MGGSGGSRRTHDPAPGWQREADHAGAIPAWPASGRLPEAFGGERLPPVFRSQDRGEGDLELGPGTLYEKQKKKYIKYVMQRYILCFVDVFYVEA